MKKFDYRENICVSHYPILSHTCDESAVKSGMVLSDENSGHATLYVHIPFCEKICPFCPFNKFVKNEKSIKEYLECLYKEIELYAATEYIKTTEFTTLALGGGTPTCLAIKDLQAVIQKCRQSFHFIKNCEITLEGNPEDITMEMAQALMESGVNRVSMGVQTFNRKHADRLGLHHTVEQSIEAIQNLHACGCDNVGIDLMYNLPEQTLEEFNEDIQKANDLGVEHISIFAITTPPKTKFTKDMKGGIIPQIGDLNREIELEISGEKMLNKLGYIQYSVYDFSKVNKVDLHAWDYFSGQDDLLGLGAAAFGYMNGFMYINKGNLEEYGESILSGKQPVLYGEKADKKEKMHGMMAKGLRMLRVSRDQFESKFGEDPVAYFSKTIEELKNSGYLDYDSRYIFLTQTGKIFGNNVCQEFISEECKKNKKILRNVLTKGVKEENF